MFGPQLFKKLTVFSLVIISASLSIVTTTSIFLGNTYVIMITMFFLAAIAGVASIKMEQWLVTSVDHKILASTVGLLNTILMAVAPIMTTVFNHNFWFIQCYCCFGYIISNPGNDTNCSDFCQFKN